MGYYVTKYGKLGTFSKSGLKDAAEDGRQEVELLAQGLFKELIVPRNHARDARTTFVYCGIRMHRFLLIDQNKSTICRL